MDDTLRAQAFGCVGSTIRLDSGTYFDLLAPRAEDILLEDIAGSLAKICRFGGHVAEFYSVAEHSWHCADQAREDGLPVEYQRAALLHDATEAYVGDMVKPLKVLLPDYRRIEQRIEHVIRERFSLLEDAAAWAAVKEIDRALLIAERNALFTPRPEELLWAGEPEARPLDRSFPCWSPGQATSEFLILADELGVHCGRGR